MSYKKSSMLPANEQTVKPKSKNFLSCLAKNIFHCKSNRKNAKRDDYVMFSYTQNDQSSNSTIPQAASTMIQQTSPLNYNRVLPPKAQSIDKLSIQSKDLSVYVSEEQLNDQYYLYDQEKTFQTGAFSDESYEAEVTRRGSLNSMNSNQRNYDINYEQLTIVRQSTSPISEYKTMKLDDLSDSCAQLHSTKILEQTDSSEMYFLQTSETQFAAPRNSFESVSTSTESPTSSSHIDAENPVHQISMIDSIISSLSTSATMENVTLACVSDYEATFVDDISVQFADTVRILRDDNEEWLFVQVVKDGRKGFIPRTIALDLNQFLGKLKQHKEVLTKSKVSLLNF